MSWRHPATNDAAANSATNSTRLSVELFRNFINSLRSRALQESVRVADLWVRRFDHQEELVRACHREALDIEHRVIRLRQAVQHDHAYRGGQRRKQDGQFVGRNDEGRPT